MLERLENAIDRAFIWAEYRLMSQIHPELTRLKNPKDRRWAMWYGLEGTPAWQRVTALLTVFLIGPVAATIALLGIAAQQRWLDAWPLIVLIGPAVGFLCSAIVVETIRGRSIAQRYYRAMRIFGHDVCPSCGYDMSGHEVVAVENRTCPECAAAVAPIDEPSRSSRSEQA